MVKRIIMCLMVGFMAVVLAGASFAAVSPFINVQGKLTPPPKADSGQTYGTVSMAFTITSPTITGSWTQTKDISVDATTGIFNAAIGDSPSLLASNILNNGDAVLNISLSYQDASSNNIGPISIDESLNSAPYALRADAASVTYGNLTYPNVSAALDNLFGAVYPASSSLQVNPNQGEKGVSTPLTLSWTVSNFTPTSQKIDGVERTSPWDTSVSDTTTFNLVASDTSGHTASASATITFYHRIFWGITNTVTLSSLSGGQLGSKAGSYPFSPTAENSYMYFAFPDTLGSTASFTYLGAEDGGWVKQQNTINYNGYNYIVYVHSPVIGNFTYTVN